MGAGVLSTGGAGAGAGAAVEAQPARVNAAASVIEKRQIGETPRIMLPPFPKKNCYADLNFARQHSSFFPMGH
jgi:hypothetical protein